MRFYKLLLHLYPSAFRAEYEDELLRVFVQNRRDATWLLAFWMKEIIDTVYNALAVHWDILRSDVRCTAKTAIRRPGFAIIAIVVTALGIGANTAVFSVVNHVLIRPLPYADSERIVRLFESVSTGTNQLSPADYRDWKRRATSFSAMGAYTNSSLNLVGKGPPERIEVARATVELLPLLGVKPLLGRWFTAAEDRTGATGVALISFGLWRARFNEDPNVLGERIRLDDETYTLIGVMPASFTFPDRNTRLWIPMRFDKEAFDDRDNTYLYGIAKLKSDVSLEEAIAELAVITKELEREYPVENAKTGAFVQKLRDGVSPQSRLLLAVLMGASLCVLLIACTNLANLFLVRAIGRRSELTVRAALGAGRERLIRQLMTESLVFAVTGFSVGVILAHAAVPFLSRLIPTSLPVGDATVIDVRVLGFATAALCITAFGFGVLPAIRILRNAGAAGLREGTRSVIGDKKEGLRSALVLAEIAATVVLLICSGLLIRAFWRVQSIDPGFATENVWTMQTPLPLPKYETTARRVDFYSRVLSEIRAHPDVSNAAYITGLPMVMRGGIWAVLNPGGINPTPGDSKTVSLRFATPQFFDSVKIPLITGRDISESDTIDAPFVAVVSETFVRHHFPGENPLGRQFHIAFADRTIVGVVGDIRVRGLERSSEPQVYLPHQQVEDGSLIYYGPKALVIRTKVRNDSGISEMARKAIQRTDPEMPVADVQMLSEILEEETSPRATQIRVIGAFAILSFLLAAIGIHGLLTFSMSQRIPEIGLRIALGASSNDILKIVLRRGLFVAGVGSFIGLTLGYGAARALQALLAGIQPGDLRTFATALAVALIMTISGCLLPAVRALRIDPALVIRGE
jgi:predicted permease